MGHEHAGGDRGCTEVARNVCLRRIDRSLAPPGVVLSTPEADAYGTRLGGFIVAHDREGLEVRCEGFVDLDRWSMTGSLEGGDLTLNPSILCRLGSASVRECGFHGWVRDGKWVPA